MLKSRLAKPMLVALAACSASVAFNGVVFADDAQTQALKDQMRIMQQQMQDLQNKIEALSKQQAAPPPVAATVPAPAKKETPAEPLFDKFAKGFYGTLDVSLDDTTKGMNRFVAYGYDLVDPNNPNSGYVRHTSPKAGGAGPVGRVGYMPALSTNKSVLGYRGSHKIGESGTDFIYQIETQPARNISWARSSVRLSVRDVHDQSRSTSRSRRSTRPAA